MVSKTSSIGSLGTLIQYSDWPRPTLDGSVELRRLFASAKTTLDSHFLNSPPHLKASYYLCRWGWGRSVSTYNHYGTRSFVSNGRRERDEGTKVKADDV